MEKALPHCQFVEPRGIPDCIREITSGNEKEIYFVVSNDFYDAKNYDLSERIYPEYEAAFQSLSRQVSSAVGAEPQAFEVGADDFPEWAIGIKIAVWKERNLYLRVEHEDRELPIIVALASIPSDET
ncbi:MAG: hypothetical protein ABFD92_01675 [Planctomycetaceae bacterium]|nr:hypothetical protein [Planctomycetaceae bacterium]